MREGQIYEATKAHLLGGGWRVVGGQPPNGTDKTPVIEIKRPGPPAKGSAGSYKPDLVAIKANCILILEIKPRFSPSDVRKVREVLANPGRIACLRHELEQRRIIHSSAAVEPARVAGGIAFAGEPVELSDLFVLCIGKNGEFTCRTPHGLTLDD